LPLLAEAKEAISDKKNWERILNCKITPEELDADSRQRPVSQLIFEQNDRSARLFRKIDIFTKSEDGQIELNEEIELTLGKFIDFVVIKDS
jgi:hypothetical protein